MARKGRSSKVEAIQNVSLFSACSKRELGQIASLVDQVDDRRLEPAGSSLGHPGVLTSQPFQGLRLPPDALEELLTLCDSFGGVRNPGSYALQLAHVAAGRARAALELTAAAPWDIAGGVALVQATGCAYVPLTEPWPGHGSWASHSYLAVRDGQGLEERVARLQQFIERGTVPEQLTIE
jgi:myo-inositol-1(or 4)-monophosphatase